MLRSFLRLFCSQPQRPYPIDPRPPSDLPDAANSGKNQLQGKSLGKGNPTPHVLLYARVDRPQSKHPIPNRVYAPPVATGSSHRARLLSMQLEHTRICSAGRCRRLRELGIVTAGDLSNAAPAVLASHFKSTRKAARVLRQYRRAIRFAAAVPGMMPRDAMLLICIHRRSVRGLAMESPAVLHRDLRRFSESTQGRMQLRGRRLPSTRRLKRWITQCESVAVHSTMQTRAA